MAAVDPQTMEAIRQGMRNVKAPKSFDRVYKDECLLSFDTPQSPGGLYINLSTHKAYGDAVLHLDPAAKNVPVSLYLHIKETRIPKTEEEMASKKQEVQKLAIGMEGGFGGDEERIYTIDKTYRIVAMPSRAAVDFPNGDLPMLVSQAAEEVIKHQGSTVQDGIAAWEDKPQVSKYAKDLVQLPDAPKIPPQKEAWKCQRCGRQNNLWLNLSDGFIGCGRRQYGVPESGCEGDREGAAIEHYKDAGSKYPLAVKLGTITAQGTADVYSYASDENDLVEDPHLAQHLAHFGINIMALEKTEKSLAELNVQFNLNYEWGKVCEDGKQLVPLSGQGLVGLQNLGNSCYMNSCVQLLCALPEVRAAFGEKYKHIIESAHAVSDPAEDFITQFAKLAHALQSDGTENDRQKTEAAFKELAASMGVQVKDPAPGVLGVFPELSAIAPRMFRHCVGKGHSEFSTGRQQDAQEYWLYLMDKLEKAERHLAQRAEGAKSDVSKSFWFRTEKRLETAEHQVRYSYQAQQLLSLHVPLDAAVNKEAVKQYEEESAARAVKKLDPSAAKEEKESKVLPLVPLDACLQHWAAPHHIEKFRNTSADETSRLRSFPKYLLLHLMRFYVKADWTPGKLEVEVDVPDHIDISHLAAKGQQPHEQPLLEESAPAASSGAGGAGGASAAPAAKKAFEYDPVLQMQITSMGFSDNAAKRAMLALKGRGANVDACLEWIFAHMEDPDINDEPKEEEEATKPMEVDATSAGGAGGDDLASEVDQLAVAQLASMMGFSERQASAALLAAGPSPDSAANWLFGQMDDLDGACEKAIREHFEKKKAAKAAGPAGLDINTTDAELNHKAADGKPIEGEETKNGKYRLRGFISHVGANAMCGHYVVHIKQGDRWVIYNDAKVAVSEEPPRRFGYLYLYERVDN